MKKLTGKTSILVATLVFALLGSSLALAKTKTAAGGYTLFGDATLVHPGNNSPTAAQIQSDTTRPPGYGGVDYGIPAGLTVADLNNLSTDYKFTSGTCGVGSPRFGADVTSPDGLTSGTIFFYIGPPPNYTACPPNVWLNTGNLAAPANLVDTSQLPAGTFYDPYAVAQVKYGSYTINDIFIVVDTGYIAPQIVLVDNTMINSITYTFEDANSCKKGGYQQFTGAPGPFQNQGQCVSYFANGGR
ncbi:MAG: hypothetical protein QOJ02_3484 [Acidobacteriota bacterium]|jgi:hypothetical protein|nr:hypothetical protein [Acidobacteriota bacterium]